MIYIMITLSIYILLLSVSVTHSLTGSMFDVGDAMVVKCQVAEIT